MFFSEEKNQKTFVPALISAGVLVAGTHGDIGFGQKFFGSFFQKRTFFCLLVRCVNVNAVWYYMPLSQKSRSKASAAGKLRNAGLCCETWCIAPSHMTARRGSRALHDHPGKFDGTAYNSRHNDEALCYALFDRARGTVREASRKTELDQDWFWDIAEPYGVGLAP